MKRLALDRGLRAGRASSPAEAWSSLEQLREERDTVGGVIRHCHPAILPGPKRSSSDGLPVSCL
jgi:hypothetical protein